MMIAAGNAGRPGASLTRGAGREIIAVEFKKTGAGQSQFKGGAGSKETVPVVGQEMADQRRGKALDELLLFITARMSGKDGFSALKLAPAGQAGPLRSSPACRLPGFARRSGCVPAEPHPPPKRARIIQIKNVLATGAIIIPLLIAQTPAGFDRTTTAKYSVN
jgi:hypothetical protein